jgi:UDP-GlcNAc:undecaprenyl-phosphate/decaprenyl-phosphate GlcNAc-1-phosphate transferase
LLCLALAGALVGFLRYNISPARVYLGDTGSMLIGLVVAAVAIDCSIKQEAAFALAVPLALCAIPILDAAAALVRRAVTGQSVFAADRGHLHHALLLRGWSVNKTVMIITGLAAITCGGALVSYFTNNDFFAMATAIGVVASLAIARVFGHAETVLVVSRSMSLAREILSRGARHGAAERESAVQLQGSRKWHSLWTALREASPVYNVTGLTLQIGMPHLHESFFANWKSSESTSNSEAWRITLPLKLDDQPIGKLILTGSASGMQALADMQQMLDFLEPLHGRIAELVHGENLVAEESWRATLMSPGLGLSRTGSLEPASGMLN